MVFGRDILQNPLERKPRLRPMFGPSLRDTHTSPHCNTRKCRRQKATAIINANVALYSLAMRMIFYINSGQRHDSNHDTAVSALTVYK